VKKDSRSLLYDQKDGIVYIRLNRPDMKHAINILSGQCIEGIRAFLEKRAPKWQP
jgi:enoyl-CoA hydratase/carnithine racemase